MSECPRWRLTEPHYIHVPCFPDGTRVEWEHKETNRESGRAVRKLYTVPLLLDPRDKADFNHPDDIIIARDVEGAHHNPRDLIFLGDPTPGMEPLNEEAEAISNALRHKWEHPVDTLPANGGMTNQEQQFMQTMMAEFAKQVGASLPSANASVPQADFDALKAELATLKALVAEKFAATNAGPTTPIRR